MQYWTAKILYNAIWIPWYLTLKLLFRYNVVYEDKSARRMRGPFIIAANHSSWIDPFVISGIFPIFSSVYPIRFAAYPRLFFNPFVGIAVYILGTFPAQKGIPLSESLATPVKFLKNAQVVGIFPEGRRRHYGRPRKGRRGAAYLAINTGVKILPVSITGTVGINLKNIFTHNKNIEVCVGKPFRLPKEFKNADDIDQLTKATEIIMEKIHKVCL